MNNKRMKRSFLRLAIPSFLGFVLFYLFPYGQSLWYSVISDPFRMRFVSFENYISIFENSYFRLALRNTIVFMAIGVSLLLTLSVTLSLWFDMLGRRWDWLKSFFVLPLLLPTASVIFAWELFFGGGYEQLMYHSTASGFFQVLPIYLLYLWKNAGFNVIILTTALASVPREALEASALDGADRWRQYRSVSLPMITPALFFAGVLSFVNSLKIFRETYLFYGTNYPPDAAYTLQFYINNHFFKLNYQTLTASVISFALTVAVIIGVAYKLENRLTSQMF